MRPVALNAVLASGYSDALLSIAQPPGPVKRVCGRPTLGTSPELSGVSRFGLGELLCRFLPADFDISSHLWYTIFEIEYREVDSFERTAGDIVH